jgi:hypothetical protein
MGKNANELAMRDPALAALMGVVGSDFGSDASIEAPVLYAGAESNFGVDFGDDEYDMGFSDIGADFGVDFGQDATTPPAPAGGSSTAIAHAAAAHGATPQGRAIIAQHMAKQAHRNTRAMLLEPNKYSDLKVERYTFAINATITALGTAGALSGSNSPDVNFRPQRVTTNVVSPAMVLITDGRVANVSFTVGGSIDAWQWNANAVGEHLDVPTLTPANKASFSGSYTGLVPSPLSGTGSYTFMMSFTGPSSIVA